MNTVTIEIKGMGGIINFESLIIERLFKELGYEIEVNNPHSFVERHPHPSMISETEDEFIERVKKLDHHKNKVIINVTHCSWGG
jgi:hypothetical protein